MKVKRITLLLTVLSIISSFLQIPSFASSENAGIIFGENKIQSRMTAESVGETDVRDGKGVIVLNPDTAANLKINMGAGFSGLADGSCVRLTVTYYDEGEGKFTLYYDGVNGKTEHPDIVRLKNTCIWKTKVYEFQNPQFNKGADGADIVISLNTPSMDKSAGKVIISEIKAEKTDYKSVYVADISTDNRPGNIYFSDEELMFTVNVEKNGTMSVYSNVCKLTYEVRDDSGAAVWSATEENVNVENGYTKIVKPEGLKYGIYDFYVTAENAEYNYKSTYSTYFAYAVAARKNDRFGVKTHYGHQYPDPEKAVYLMEKAGIGFSNGGWGWAGIEKSVGKFSYGTGPVSKYQDLMDKSEVDMMHSASYGNVLYTGAPTDTYMPETDAAMEAFANAAVWSITAHDNEYIEVWNEPDMTNFNPGHVSWETYAKLLKVTYEKVKAVNPDIKVIGGSLVAIPLLSEDKLKGILDAGGGEYMDALSIHPYIWETSPLNDNFQEKLPVAGELLAKMGYPDKEIWITELGWGAGPGQKFTYEQQAAYLVQTYLMSLSYKNFGKFMWYDFQNDGLVETDKEDMFGLVKHWTDKKPWAAHKSFIATSFMNQLMAGAEYVDNSTDGNDGYMYHYKNDGKDIYAVFSSKKSYLCGVSGNCDKATVYDMYGNEDTLYASNGVLNILGGEEVIYIVGENLNLEFAEPTVTVSTVDASALFGEGAVVNVNANEKITIECNSVNDDVKLEKQSENSVHISYEEVSADEDRVRLTVKSGEKMILTGDILASCTQLLTASISNDLFNGVNFNRWRGYLTVTNNSAVQTTAPGFLTFESPDLFSKKLPKIAVPSLRPGERRTIKFHFPEILRKEAYDVNAVIKLSDGYVIQVSERIDFAAAPYAEKKPVIDGKIESNEWVMGAALDFGREDQAVNLAGFSWNGKEDLSGRVCFEYDEEYLYLGAQVTDDVFFQENPNEKIWQGDSIQFAVGYSRANGNKESNSFTEVGIALTPEDEKVCVYGVEDISIGRGILDMEALGIECEIQRNGVLTTYELKMPWTALVPRGSEFTGGKNVAFSMLVNDNDGLGRKGWLEYASGVGLSKNINLFTFLKLMNK